jgi:hypothetical protein
MPTECATQGRGYYEGTVQLFSRGRGALRPTSQAHTVSSTPRRNKPSIRLLSVAIGLYRFRGRSRRSSSRLHRNRNHGNDRANNGRQNSGRRRNHHTCVHTHTHTHTHMPMNRRAGTQRCEAICCTRGMHEAYTRHGAGVGSRRSFGHMGTHIRICIYVHTELLAHAGRIDARVEAHACGSWCEGAY